MDYTALVTELRREEYSLDAKAGVTLARAQEIAAAMNKPVVCGARPKRLSTEEVLNAIGEAKEIAKIEAQATDEAAALAVYLYGAGGVDMAESSVARAMLAATISADAMARVVAAATEDIVRSRAEQLGLEPVGDGHVLSAVAMLEVA